LRSLPRAVRHGDDRSLIQPVHHGGVDLIAVSFRHREERKASQVLMLKQMRLLRHRGRSAKQQNKAAAGGSEAVPLVHDGEARRVYRRDCRQVLNGKQCHPDRQLTGGGKDLEASADRAGKRAAAKVVQRCGVVVPVVRAGSGSSTRVTFFTATDGDPAAVECHR